MLERWNIGKIATNYRFMVSAQSLAAEATSLIKKETKVVKIPNLKHQIINIFQITISKFQIRSKTNCLEF
jgi:hypothetical protein